MFIYESHIYLKYNWMCIYFRLVAFEGSTYSRFCIIITAVVKFCVVAVKCRRLHLSILIFRSFSIRNSNTLIVENWITLYIAVARVLKRCCTFYHLSWTGSIKPTLQFSFINFDSFALEGSSTFTIIHFFLNIMCYVIICSWPLMLSCYFSQNYQIFKFINTFCCE